MSVLVVVIDSILHIYYTDSYAQYERIIPSKLHSKIAFEKVDYSLNYLHNLQENITNILSGELLCSCWISTKDNKVIIESKKDNLNVIRTLLDKYDLSNEPVLIIEGYENSACTTDLHGGDALNDRTLSVCGTQGTTVSIITCGHLNETAATAVGTTFTLSGSSTTVATASTVVYANNGYGDYSICTVNTSSYNTTNKIKYFIGNYVDCAGGVIDLANGEYLVKYGKNGGYAGITITSKTQNVTYTNQSTNSSWTIKGLVSTSVSVGDCVDGDSGGPIIRYVSSNGKYYYAGSVSGSAHPKDENNNELPATNVYFCPYSMMALEFTVKIQ